MLFAMKCHWWWCTTCFFMRLVLAYDSHGNATQCNVTQWCASYLVTLISFSSPRASIILCAICAATLFRAFFFTFWAAGLDWGKSDWFFRSQGSSNAAQGLSWGRTDWAQWPIVTFSDPLWWPTSRPGSEPLGAWLILCLRIFLCVYGVAGQCPLTPMDKSD